MKKVIAILGMAMFLVASVPYVSASNAKYSTTMSVEKHKKSGKKSKSKTGTSKKTSKGTSKTQDAATTKK